MTVYIDPRLMKIIDPLNRPLLRYMSFDSFEKLIESSSLFFSKISEYPDQYEGRIPSKTIALAIKNNSDITLSSVMLDEIILAWERSDEKLRKEIFACCWFLHPNLRESGELIPIESNIMWEAYTRRNLGVAICVKIGKLLPLNHRSIALSDVIYHNPQDSKSNIDITISRDGNGNISFENLSLPGYPFPVKLAIYKTNNYSLESEVRLITYEKFEDQDLKTQSGKGILVPISDLNDFISEIIVSPFIGDEKIENIKEFLIQKGHSDLAQKVRRSTIMEKISP